MRVVFMGTPEFAVPSLKGLVLDGHQVVAVYTRPDRPAGRGRRLAVSPVKKAAAALNLPVVQPVNFKEAATVAELGQFCPDVIVVAAYGRILPTPVLNTPRYGSLNLHPSLLPRHRGASPVVAAILNGDEFSGVTIMLMDAGLDTGPVLARVQIPIADWDTTGSLTTRLSLVAAHLLGEVLTTWPRGEISPQPQDEAAASFSGIVTKADGEIDWGQPAPVIWRQVRALQPWPGGYTWWRGKMLKIIEVRPRPHSKKAKIGEVLALPSSGEGAAFAIATGDGILGVIKVQLEGKRVMSSAEFLRGQRQFIGAVLPQG